MFFNNKKETTPICTANNGLPECDSVAKIKEYQKQLNDMKTINYEELIKKYFMGNYYIAFRGNGITHIVEDMIRYCKSSHITCEEYFGKFGRDLDTYLNQENTVQSLNAKIKNEKKKLGIE